MNHIALGSRTFAITAARFGLAVGEENFALDLDTAGDGAPGHICIFGYCEPPLPRLDALAECTLWTAVEDPADYFFMHVDGVNCAVAPFTGDNESIVLAVAVVGGGRVAVRYHGTFLVIDPAGDGVDGTIDVRLDVVADWDSR